MTKFTIASRARDGQSRLIPKMLVRSLVVVALTCTTLLACSGGDQSNDRPGGGSSGSGGRKGTGGGGSGTGGTAGVDSTATLPLEVLGNGNPRQPVIASLEFDLEEAALGAVTQLWFRCHRCGSYGAPEFEVTTAPPTKVKGSVRILGGTSTADEAEIPWIDITGESLELGDDERIHGGLDGGLYTTRLTLKLDEATKARLIAGHNRVQFRFNGTDGDSNGFRILDLELRDGAERNLLASEFAEFDPALERDASQYAADDVTAGKALWYERGILTKSAIVDRKIQASCSSCHAPEGRDLQYFNYSNNAIIQRSRFHGLSEAEGRQIAAFLRSSLQDVPNYERARPWNPPYQPGPGLDCDGGGDCAGAWSAGAGLDAVLETTDGAVRALFGKPARGPLTITQADVDAVMDANAIHNVRETPIAMQFPDWNAWLPTVHPMDVWPSGSEGGGFEEGGATFANGTFDPKGKYDAVSQWFSSHGNEDAPGDWSHLTPAERTEIMTMLTQTGWETYSFLGGGRGAHIAADGKFGAQIGADNLMAAVSNETVAAGPQGAFTTNAFIERAVLGMLHWNAVQQWALAQAFRLEGDQKWFIGEQSGDGSGWEGRGEAPGWPFNAPSVFYLAPHMTYQTDYDGENQVTREWILAWETDAVMASYYRTNQWYQLQMTVNAGAQSGWVNYPMDWPYLTGFDELIAHVTGGDTPAEANARDSHWVRLLQGRIKSAQYVNNSIPLYDPGEPNLVANAGRYGRAQALKHLTTTNYLDGNTVYGTALSPFHFLDDLQPGLYLLVVNGAIQQFNQLYAGTSADDWRRCDPANTVLGEQEDIAGFRYCVDAGKQPLGVNGDGSLYMNYTDYGIPTEQVEQFGLWRATELGTEPTRTKTWSDWLATLWP